MSTKRTVISTLVVILLTLAGGVPAFAQPGQQGGQHQGPPPEAFTACENKSAGDRASFESPHGDSVTGTCREHNGKLVLVPDNPPPQMRQRQGGAPQRQ